MSYTTIMNNPWERKNITYPWVYLDNAFTEEQLQKMSKYFAEQGLERGKTVDDTETKYEQYRKSNVKFHDRNENTAWIYDRFNWVIQQLNEQFYGFDLYGYDTIQYSEYESVEGGHYDFHMDTILGKNLPPEMQNNGTRKLSVVMCLNRPNIDFTGGEFEVNINREVDATKIDMPRGRIIVFPSWIIHRVAPTTSGKRKSLVIWVDGPKFR